MEGVRRGAIITIAAPGPYGKPRPALVIQSDLFDQHPSATVCLITSEIRDVPLFRVTVQPSPDNGLRKTSQVMVDKIVTLPRERIGSSIGMLEPETLVQVTRLLALWLGMA